MKIFADTSKITEIEYWLGQGVIDGVTTNPSIMRNNGLTDFKSGAQTICKLVSPLPVSVEVYASDVPGMLTQAREIASWGDNVVVKIPVTGPTGESCLGIIKTLSSEGVLINCTALMSMGQAMLAAKAGATYVSLFAGRIGDEGGSPEQVISDTRGWIDDWDYDAEIIVGSIREVNGVLQAARAGAHIITIPPQFLAKMLDHKNTRATVQQFVEDGQSAFD
jgi:transaldolase